MDYETINSEIEELTLSLKTINKKKEELDNETEIIIKNIRSKYRNIVKNGYDALKYLYQYMKFSKKIGSLSYCKYEDTDDETDEDNDIVSNKYKISFSIFERDIHIIENIILELCSPYFIYMDSNFTKSDDDDVEVGRFTMYLRLK
jgi:hypothetical protein